MTNAFAQGMVDPANTSPVGFTSAVNTPTAQVLREGTLAMSLANNNPELGQRITGVGGFGSLNFGAGLLPGLEAFGRLAFEGDLQCNQYAGFLRPGGCQSGMRDLSFSVKYQLPLNLPLNTKLAAGFIDFGGAATNFRGSYAVATSEQGPFDFSLGYGSRVSDRAFLQGGFASVVARLTERAQVQLENNAGATRLGASYQVAMGDGADLLLGASRSLGDPGRDAIGAKPLNSSQVSVTLRVHLERAKQQALRKTAPDLANYEAPISRDYSNGSALAQTAADQKTAAAEKIAATEKSVVTDEPNASEALLREMTRALQADGFTRVSVSMSSSMNTNTNTVSLASMAPEARVFHVQLEPSAYRQSSLFAMGRAVRVWLQVLGSSQTIDGANAQAPQKSSPSNELVIALTYLGQPTVAAKTSEHCAKLFRAGHDVCAQGRALELLRPSDLPEGFAQTVKQQASFSAPQLELGVALRSAVGTEYGIADYALAAELGAELSLANIKPGLGAQALWRVPASSSGDFRAGGIHYANRFEGPRIEQALLTYWMPIKLVSKPLPIGEQDKSVGINEALRQVDAALVFSAGSLMHGHTGAQAELHATLDRWRVLGTWGTFKTSEFERARSPALTSVSYSIEPAKWRLDLAAGRFYNLDRGWRLGSVHWFGDTSFTAYVKDSGFKGLSMPKRRFAGFEVSFPLGQARASNLAGVSMRGRDRWTVGLETKVLERDNYITRGYGLVPAPRHGLVDVSDQDRMVLQTQWAARSALRLALQ